MTPLALILAEVSRLSAVPINDLLRPGRGRRRVWRRQIGYWISRETIGASYPAIASCYGRTSASTVVAGIIMFERRMARMSKGDRHAFHLMRDNCAALLARKEAA